MVRHLQDNLPFIFVIALPISYIAYACLGYFSNPTLITTYDFVIRASIFLPLAIAVTGIFFLKVALCRRSEDGRVSVWLTTVTYASGGLAMTWWGMTLLLILGALHIIGDVETQESIFQIVAWSLLGGSMVIEVIALVMGIIGYFTKTLDRHIYPLPFSRKKLPTDKS